MAYIKLIDKRFNEMKSLTPAVALNGIHWMGGGYYVASVATSPQTLRLVRINFTSGDFVTAKTILTAASNEQLHGCLYDGRVYWVCHRNSSAEHSLRSYDINGNLISNISEANAIRGLQPQGAGFLMTETTGNTVQFVGQPTGGVPATIFNATGTPRGVCHDGAYYWVADGSATKKLYQQDRNGNIISQSAAYATGPFGVTYLSGGMLVVTG